MDFFRKNREADCQSQGCCNCGCPGPTVLWDQEDVLVQLVLRDHRDYRESRDQPEQSDQPEQLEPPDCRDHREFRVRPEPREQQGRRESRDQLV